MFSFRDRNYLLTVRKKNNEASSLEFQIEYLPLWAQNKTAVFGLCKGIKLWTKTASTEAGRDGLSVISKMKSERSEPPVQGHTVPKGAKLYERYSHPCHSTARPWGQGGGLVLPSELGKRHYPPLSLSSIIIPDLLCVLPLRYLSGVLAGRRKKDVE